MITKLRIMDDQEFTWYVSLEMDVVIEECQKDHNRTCDKCECFKCCGTQHLKQNAVHRLKNVENDPQTPPENVITVEKCQNLQKSSVGKRKKPEETPCTYADEAIQLHNIWESAEKRKRKNGKEKKK